jgi:hypothetical protein
VVAGQMWQMYRSEKIKCDRFYLAPGLHGAWCIRGNAIRALAALNKFEGLSSDSWGLCDKEDDELTSEDFSLLDRIAALTVAAEEGNLAEMRSLYESSS